MRPPRFRPNYANVTATLALVVALGSGAYAAGLGRNAVKSRNIAPRAVKTSDLAKGAVKRSKIARGAVSGDRIAQDTVTGANVNEASLGIVPDSRLLGGLDQSAFVHGAGRTYAVFGTDPVGGDPSAPVNLDVGGRFTLACQNPASIGSTFTFTNTSGATADVWTDLVREFTPETRESYTSVPDNGTATLEVAGPVVVSGQALERFTIAVSGRLTLIEARLAFGPAGCRFPLLITELRGS